ncbi:Arylsulfatase [Maioricimonas rarisocia]|uniref:Arylsulfatase n=1 Tax=Maioricimonas rarisocia TaxID=2528026 RepID=A0A517Z353_9PLAN|nr:sulfatase-like hydrolase/transferase [Maioricimonas rarisocia]QDU36922.1 Arylsulfatase [Maioricimonas rarisocia]
MRSPLPRRLTILCGLLCGLLCHHAGTAIAAPNVLFLLTDDQRPDTIGSLGNDLIETPHLDRLVREGTTFTRAIVAIPICVASRAEILTGRDGRLNGKENHGFSPAEGVTHWATAMRGAGYETCYVGKWHTSGRPSHHGYERSEGLYAGGGGRFPLTHPHDWKGMPVTGYRGWVFQTDDRTLFPELGVGLTPDISSDFADAAIGFLREDREQPFFLHVNFTAPHDPLFVPTGYEDRYSASDIPLPVNFRPEHPFDHGNAKGRDEVLFGFPRTEEETRRGLAVYYAVITHLDAQIGRILATLEETGQLDETIILISSDHGLAMGSHGLRGKQNMYEHSIGVPLIFRGPGIPADQRTDAQCYLRDLYPTVCELTGVEIPETVHGRSLVPVIRGEAEQAYDAVFGHFRDVQRMIRTPDWKYVWYPQVQQEQLFHLADDPHELHDLSQDAAHESTRKQLRAQLDAEWERIDALKQARP